MKNETGLMHMREKAAKDYNFRHHTVTDLGVISLFNGAINWADLAMFPVEVQQKYYGRAYGQKIVDSGSEMALKNIFEGRRVELK